MLCDAVEGTYAAVYEARASQISLFTPGSLSIPPAPIGFLHPPALQTAQTTGTEAAAYVPRITKALEVT